jgi:hypothetical protein
MATVGETRAWLESAYGIPHTLSTHFVIVTDASGDLGIIGCCDGTDEAGILLAVALRAISGEARPSPESGSVIVFREDLLLALSDSGLRTRIAADAYDRLAEAAGLATEPPADPAMGQAEAGDGEGRTDGLSAPGHMGGF